MPHTKPFALANGCSSNGFYSNQLKVTEMIMDKDLIDGARQLFTDELFETVRRCYCEANKDYLNKQMKIASEYMTDKQKEKLRQRGITI